MRCTCSTIDAALFEVAMFAWLQMRRLELSPSPQTPTPTAPPEDLVKFFGTSAMITQVAQVGKVLMIFGNLCWIENV